jgi:hypothetical protein
MEPRHAGMLIRRAANEGVSQRVLGELIGLKPLTSLLRWLAAAQGITEQNLPGVGHRCPEQYASRLRPARMRQQVLPCDAGGVRTLCLSRPGPGLWRHSFI